MSVPTETNKIQYNANGSLTVFAVTFNFFETSDLAVFTTDTSTGIDSDPLTEGVDYTVTGGDGSTGSITTTDTYASGIRITIARELDMIQESQYSPGGDFPESTVEGDFDKSAMQSGQNWLRSLLIAWTETFTGPIVLPKFEADKFLQINSAGEGFVLADSSTTSDARVNDLFNGGNSNDISPLKILFAGGPRIIEGAGTPEAAVVAPVGSIFLRNDGGADTSIYFKETGAGNTGWVARGTLAAPTITSYANATHDHADAAGGGVLTLDNLIKAWGNWTGATPPVKVDDYNITSVTRSAAGKFTINFDTNFASAAYCLVCTAIGSTGDKLNIMVVTQAAGSATIEIVDQDGVFQDPSNINFIAIGAQ